MIPIFYFIRSVAQISLRIESPFIPILFNDILAYRKQRRARYDLGEIGCDCIKRNYSLRAFAASSDGAFCPIVISPALVTQFSRLLLSEAVEGSISLRHPYSKS